ncbi:MULTISPECIES: DUF2949 domain-containing protein [Nostocales]|uniref:DUF2949 domain-containing protein n=1 Tax=Nostocales TaxID=1161 RepID=UPI000CA1FA75|nr:MULTISPECIES: DUF2949 domain-containing protein [unclassified Nostoc]AUS98950.1 DUF2949 domain-containing protein [Nostoc sp. CENA543]MCF4965656.1 DUF2949 domain-containing protein [Nostoc sp. CMAA1605]
MTTHNKDVELLDFLHNELALSHKDIAIALKHRELDPAPLPMLLWQYGLVNLEELEKILDWLHNNI